MAKEFECERDEVVICGAGDDELVANLERHIAEAHPDLVGKVPRGRPRVGEGGVSDAQRRCEMTAGDGLVLHHKRVLPAPVRAGAVLPQAHAAIGRFRLERTSTLASSGLHARSVRSLHVWHHS